MFTSRVLALSRHFNSEILRKNTCNILRLAPRTLVKSAATAEKPEKSLDEIIDVPVKFSTSGARKWRAEASRLGYKEERLWYEPYVILASLSVFLIYFTILREENDIDEELKKSLYSRIEGLEEHQLRVSLEFNKEHNLDTSQIIARLKELEQEKLSKTM